MRTAVPARHVLDEIPTGRAVSVERETFPDLLDRGKVVMGYLEDCYWIDVGTPESLRRASCDLVLGVAASPAYPGPASSWLRGDGVDVAPSADIGGGAALGDGVRVADGARIESSVVMSGAQIGAGAHVVRSVVGEGAVVGPQAVLEDCAVADYARVESPGT